MFLGTYISKLVLLPEFSLSPFYHESHSLVPKMQGLRYQNINVMFGTRKILRKLRGKENKEEK